MEENSRQYLHCSPRKKSKWILPGRDECYVASIKD